MSYFDRPGGLTVLGGRYRLGYCIGRGGMADVHRAEDIETGREVAVKVFRPGIDTADTAPRMRREVNLLSSLRHPGLVEILDADVEVAASAGHPPYLVMELVDGETLRDRMRRLPLSEAAVASLGAQLCATLAYVHSRGVVHRDIKPANILLTSAADPSVARAKLTDFGIARLVDSTRMTADGFMVGTANYLSPEQVSGAAVGTPSDIYALGLVLVEAMNRSVVFPGHGAESAIARLNVDPRIDARTAPELASLLSDMTARDPRHRPTAAKASERFQRLDAAGLSERVPGPDDETAPVLLRSDTARTVRRTPRRRFALVGAGLGAAAAIAAATVVLEGATDPAPAPARPLHGAVNTPAGVPAPMPHTSTSAPPASKSASTAATQRDAARPTVAAVAARSSTSRRPVARPPVVAPAKGRPASVHKAKKAPKPTKKRHPHGVG